MAKLTDGLPFARGQTYFNDGTVDATSGAHLEGKEYWVEDTQNNITGRYIKLRAVRNVATFDLESRRLVRYKASNQGQVDGYATVEPTQHLAVVDDAYGSSGKIKINDIGYVVVEGPVLILTSLQGGAENNFAVDDALVAAAAATSGATTSGRFKPADFTGATVTLAAQILGIIGRALTSRTTANTNTATLIAFGRW